MSNNPLVVVLMLSYDGKVLLKDALSTYLNNDYAHYKIVLIDNGSKDDTEEYVTEQFPNVDVLRIENNRGYSGGFNYGLQYASRHYDAKYYLITNNDVKADKQLISSLVTKAETETKVGFVTGKVYYYDHPDIFQTVGKKADPVYWNGGHIGRNEVDKGQFDEDKELAWCDDIYWLVSAEMYAQTGGYDEEYRFQGEDFDWQIRAKKLGYKILYAHQAKLWHKESMTIGRVSAFKAYYDYRNALLIRMKYQEYKEFSPYYKLIRKMLFRATIKNMIKLRFAFVFYCWKGFISAIAGGVKMNKISTRQIFF